MATTTYNSAETITTIRSDRDEQSPTTYSNSDETMTFESFEIETIAANTEEVTDATVETTILPDNQEYTSEMHLEESFETTDYSATAFTEEPMMETTEFFISDYQDHTTTEFIFIIENQEI